MPDDDTTIAEMYQGPGPHRKPGKVVSGLLDALDYARVERVIHDWIREDAPVNVKMTLTPEHVAKLIDRITGAKTKVPE